MRGEDVKGSFMRCVGRGSPPHAWGRRQHPQCAEDECRFTPTCVGKTRARSGQALADPVHPHMRGEDSATSGGVRRPDGSPPHAWGRPAPLTQQSGSRRFTPTCVGKTLTKARYSSCETVHPHMRGEDTAAEAAQIRLGGSPPHAWGRLVFHFWLCAPFRFTPTCVGKTPPTRTLVSPPAVHPHMRGEDATETPRDERNVGSPPHAWGRQRDPGRHTGCPAVHPHMRGEDIADITITVA